MTATKLSLYNGALRILGERKLASLTEDRLPRRLLDDAWDDGAVDYCLGQGQWAFATRTQLLDASTSIEPEFGPAYAFEMPSDWISTIAVCSDSYFRSALVGYEGETRIIYSDFSQIYVKFVSNDSTFGGDYSLWSRSFTNYVETYLASQICMTLKQKEFEENKLEMARRVAMNNTMREKAAKVLPLGNWNSSRLRGGNRYYSATGNFPV